MVWPSLRFTFLFKILAVTAFFGSVAQAIVLSPGASGCVIYRAGAYETDDKFRIAEYTSFDDFRTGTVFKTLSGEVLRLTPGHKPVIIPYPPQKTADPNTIKQRIMEAKERFRHLAMDLAAIEKAWAEKPSGTAVATGGVTVSEGGDTVATDAGPAGNAMTLASGRTLRDWRVSKVSDGKATIVHSDGVMVVPVGDIPREAMEADARLRELLPPEEPAVSTETAVPTDMAVPADMATSESSDREVQNASETPSVSEDRPSDIDPEQLMLAEDIFREIAGDVESANEPKTEFETDDDYRRRLENEQARLEAKHEWMSRGVLVRFKSIDEIVRYDPDAEEFDVTLALGYWADGDGSTVREDLEVYFDARRSFEEGVTHRVPGIREGIEYKDGLGGRVQVTEVDGVQCKLHLVRLDNLTAWPSCKNFNVLEKNPIIKFSFPFPKSQAKAAKERMACAALIRLMPPFVKRKEWNTGPVRSRPVAVFMKEITLYGTLGDVVVYDVDSKKIHGTAGGWFEKDGFKR